MHGWSDLPEKKKRRRRRSVQSQGRICILLQAWEHSVSSCRRKHSVAHWWQYLMFKCASRHRNVKSSAEKRDFFFLQKFSISHYIIDHWGILHSASLLKGKKVSGWKIIRILTRLPGCFHACHVMSCFHLFS